MPEVPAEHALSGEELGNEIADVADIDILWFEARILECREHGSGEQVEYRFVRAAPVLGKVRLCPAEQVDLLLHIMSPSARSRRCKGPVPALV
jgi:hypothetical protein